MKHATPAALRSIREILAAVRRYPQLIERKSGIFYQKSSAFLHFHEDPTGIFADLKTPRGWKRLAVSTPAQVKHLLRKLAPILDSNTKQ